MPPSAGACQTTLADARPDCGRASNWSSIITAITGRDATLSRTGTPVRGAATRTGVGAGVGVGAAVGLGASVGDGPSVEPDDGVSVAGAALSDGGGDGLPATATAPCGG